MPNPFAGRGKKERVEEFEEVGGTMDCQTCYEKVHEGKYYASQHLLTWVCSEGHRSRIEGFIL